MKGFKLSKISWLILSTGVFLVILVGLGVTRSQQMSEQSTLDAELESVQLLADKVQTADLQEQFQDLQDQVEEAGTQVKEARQRLDQTVISADVDEKFFSIARYSNVDVKTISTTTIGKETLSGVGLSKTTISCSVTGEMIDIVNFVINLNNGYTTGYITSVSISISDNEEEEENLATASLQMTVYSYEEV